MRKTSPTIWAQWARSLAIAVAIRSTSAVSPRCASCEMASRGISQLTPSTRSASSSAGGPAGWPMAMSMPGALSISGASARRGKDEPRLRCVTTALARKGFRLTSMSPWFPSDSASASTRLSQRWSSGTNDKVEISRAMRARCGSCRLRTAVRRLMPPMRLATRPIT